MKRKSLLETNPLFKDPEKAERFIYTSVTSSSAIEGVHIKPSEDWAVAHIGEGMNAVIAEPPSKSLKSRSRKSQS